MYRIRSAGSDAWGQNEKPEKYNQAILDEPGRRHQIGQPV